MKAKRFLALFTAITLIAIPTSNAFAGTLTGVTTVNYVDPVGVITVVAPTSASVGFTLDPQGLASNYGVGTWNPANGGNILPQAVGIIVNKSAAPVKAEIAFTIDDTSDEPVVLVDSITAINDDANKNMYLTFTPADAKVVAATDVIVEETNPTYFEIGPTPAPKEFTAADLVTQGLDGTSPNVVVPAEPSNAPEFGDYVCQALPTIIPDAAALEAYDFNTDASDITFYQVEVPAHAQIDATVDTTVSAFNNATTGFADTTAEDIVVLAASDTGLAFKLDNADYYAANTGANTYELRRYPFDYATSASDNYDTASFIIGGNINKNADWSDYTTGSADISLSATYTFTFMTESAFTAATTLGDTYNNIAYVAPAGPSISTPSYDIAADTAEAVSVNLGVGNLAATSITSIVDASSNTLTPTTDYAFATNTITFTSAYVNSIIGTGVADASKVLTVTFNNAATATVTLAYTAADTAPSITPTSGSLAYNTSIPITVNFGSGASLASSITSIEDSSNTLVSETDYSLSGNTLTLASAYVNTLLGDESANVSETLTVTFDTNATATISLTYTAPTITLTAAGLITISHLTAHANYTSTSLGVGTSMYDLDSEAVTLDTSAYNASTGGTYGIQLNSAYMTAYAAQLLKVDVTLSNGSVLHVETTLN